MRSNSSVASFQPAAVAVHEPGDRGVRQVGDVQRARRQRPRDPRVDGAEAQVARAVGVGHVEQERQLRRGRVRRDPQALLAQHEAHARGAQVLPADAGPDRFAGGAIPHDRRRPLVGDADGIDRTAVGQRGSAHSSAALAIAIGSNSTNPGAGDDGSSGW